MAAADVTSDIIETLFSRKNSTPHISAQEAAWEILLCHSPDVLQDSGSWVGAEWINFLYNYLDSTCILQSTYECYSSTNIYSEVLPKLIAMILIYFCIYLKILLLHEIHISPSAFQVLHSF